MSVRWWMVLALTLAACANGATDPTNGQGSTSGDPLSGSSGGDTGGSGGGVQACAQNTAITQLPGCGTSSDTIDVHAGCQPNVDGALHMEEWQDGACLTSANGDMTVYVKYAGETLYLAAATIPSCNCPMVFAFDPDGAATLDGDEFEIHLFDDPFSGSGDRFDSIYRQGAWTGGSAPSDITTVCPTPAPRAPNSITYEWAIPFSALGITPGSPHAFKLAIDHKGKDWPSTLAPDSLGNLDVSQGGTLMSSTNWQ
ncbi:MAG: hypothetical protein JST54_19985 [Deltaproteobacteria bacterium]|nr:hypothetical protein [Deltaproteobacteria bacterium]